MCLFLAGRNARNDIRRALGSLVRDSVSRTKSLGFDTWDVNAVPMYVTVVIAIAKYCRIEVTLREKTSRDSDAPRLLPRREGGQSTI